MAAALHVLDLPTQQRLKACCEEQRQHGRPRVENKSRDAASICERAVAFVKLSSSEGSPILVAMWKRGRRCGSGERGRGEGGPRVGGGRRRDGRRSRDRREGRWVGRLARDAVESRESHTFVAVSSASILEKAAAVVQPVVLLVEPEPLIGSSSASAAAPMGLKVAGAAAREAACEGVARTARTSMTACSKLFLYY